MIDSTNSVRLRHPQFRTTLFLGRTPRFLRFTRTGEGDHLWDALDQLEDEPHEGERLIAGVLVHRGAMHVSYAEKGRRKGTWWRTAEYEIVSPQPEQETMLHRDRWREWCLQQPKGQTDGSSQPERRSSGGTR